jgi:hypothetical protein
VQAYKDPSSGLLLRAAALFYNYNKNSIINHFNNIFEISQIRYTSDIYVERQLLNIAEEITLYNHIFEHYQSHLSLDVKLLYHYINELLQATLGSLREEDKIEMNWHIRFYQYHSNVKDLRTRSFDKERFINKDSDDYIK